MAESSSARAASSFCGAGSIGRPPAKDDTPELGRSRVHRAGTLVDQACDPGCDPRVALHTRLSEFTELRDSTERYIAEVVEWAKQEPYPVEADLLTDIFYEG